VAVSGSRSVISTAPFDGIHGPSRESNMLAMSDGIEHELLAPPALLCLSHVLPAGTGRILTMWIQCRSSCRKKVARRMQLILPSQHVPWQCFSGTCPRHPLRCSFSLVDVPVPSLVVAFHPLPQILLTLFAFSRISITLKIRQTIWEYENVSTQPGRIKTVCGLVKGYEVSELPAYPHSSFSFLV
jgi:hypothetical protein